MNTDFDKYMSNFKDYDIHTTEFTLNGSFLPGRLVDIIDGDSVVVILPVFNNYYKYHVRINGIDTCEIKSKNDTNKTLALKARCELLKLVTKQEFDINISKPEIKSVLDKEVLVVYLDCKEFDKYGRLLANVFIDCSKTVSLAEYLLDRGLAYVYTGETKLTENEQKEIMYQILE